MELEQGVSDMLSRKLRQLNDFLLSEAVSDDAMLLSELDGFLAGVIVCPEMIMPSEWMPVVWGDDEGPVFDDVEQAQAISGLILGHYNDIIRQLDRGATAPSSTSIPMKPFYGRYGSKDLSMPCACAPRLGSLGLKTMTLIFSGLGSCSGGLGN